MSHEIAVVAHPRVLGMELMGALDLLHLANQVLAERGRPAYYRTRLLAQGGGPLPTWSGVDLASVAKLETYHGPVDTLVVVGGLHAHEQAQDAAFVASIRRVAQRAERVVGLCTGAFILGAAGLLDGKRATTHWMYGDLLAERHPEAHVDTDPIFIGDAGTWTSAGITASFDLILALVADDLGVDVALTAARFLVMFLHRTGNQAQFSAQLAIQFADRHPIRELQQYIADHPDADLSTPRLADQVNMSLRHFTRVFTKDVGSPPGRYVEQVRLETARRRLEESDDTLDRVATECGFGSAETLRRVFHQRLGVSPGEYRRAFTTGNRRRAEPAAG
ncbi:MAG TPA: GlxA family transcriptional regulator [Sporichthyaceae bacterium]|jgi:transcriptional regulator GlxA family with amidase domain|nr:GlxA family transcriptional regulator [Sporichthyaceae bacterium]